MRFLCLSVLLVIACKSAPQPAPEPAPRAPSDAGTTLTKVRIELVGLGQSKYAINAATFKLDGRELPVADLGALNETGEHLVFHGDVEPGPHRLETKLEIENDSNPVLNPEGGYKWKIGSSVGFKTEAGIEVRIKVTPEENLTSDIKGRLSVKSPATARMLAALDDGSMPPPPPEPKIDLPDAPAIPARPAQLAEPVVPSDSPFTPQTVDLGHHLFFEKAMSADGSMACAACHLPQKAWTTANATDPKAGGEPNTFNSPTVLNLAYHSSFYWDGRMPTLEAVSNAAWKGQLGADPAAVIVALNSNPQLKARFKRAYSESATVDNVPKALASFLRALTNGDAPYDKFTAGNKKAISADAKKGAEVFKKSGCIGCHVPPLFSDLALHDVGIGGVKVKTPSLRNVALGAPYFHDGQTKTLDEAIAAMAKGGKKLDPKLKTVKLSGKDKKQLKAFLESLTGTSSFIGPPQP